MDNYIYDIGCEIKGNPAYCTGICIENIAGTRYSCCQHFKITKIKTEEGQEENAKKKA
jgi:cytidine deaminase